MREFFPNFVYSKKQMWTILPSFHSCTNGKSWPIYGAGLSMKLLRYNPESRTEKEWRMCRCERLNKSTKPREIASHRFQLNNSLILLVNHYSSSGMFWGSTNSRTKRSRSHRPMHDFSASNYKMKTPFWTWHLIT